MSTFPVPPNYGSLELVPHRKRVVDVGGIMYPGTTANTIDKLKRFGIKPILLMSPNAAADGKLLCTYPISNVIGDELVTNGGFANWTGTPTNDTPTGWTKVGTTATTYVTQNPTGSAQIVSDGSDIYISVKIY